MNELEENANEKSKVVGIGVVPKPICSHEAMNVGARMMRVGDGADASLVHRIVEIKMECVACKLPFQFLCDQVGIFFNKPTRSLDGLVLNTPIAPCEVK